MRTLTLLLIAALAGNALAQTTIPAKPVTGSPAMNAPVMSAPAMNAPAMNQMPMAPMTPVKMGSAMMNGRIPASGTIEVNGAKVYFKAVGTGKPMLLIHGYPLSGELFKNNRAALAKAGFQVITVDLPGFGKSVAPDMNASIENYARTMIGAMDALGLKTATVGGISMGGMTLLQMYKLAPTRFNGLVFIDTTAEPAGVAEAASWRGTAQQAQQMGVASIVPGILPRMLTGEDRMKMPAQVAFLSGLVTQASLNQPERCGRRRQRPGRPPGRQCRAAHHQGADPAGLRNGRQPDACRAGDEDAAGHCGQQTGADSRRRPRHHLREGQRHQRRDHQLGQNPEVKTLKEGCCRKRNIVADGEGSANMLPFPARRMFSSVTVPYRKPLYSRCVSSWPE